MLKINLKVVKKNKQKIHLRVRVLLNRRGTMGSDPSSVPGPDRGSRVFDGVQGVRRRYTTVSRTG